MGKGLERFDWFVEQVSAGTLDEAAVREGFAPAFLTAVSPELIVQLADRVRPILIGAEPRRSDAGFEFEVTYESALVARGVVERDAPHRFMGLLFRPPDAPIADDRLGDAPIQVEGEAPRDALRDVFQRYGLVGAVAGAFSDDGATPLWRAGIGFTDLEAGAPATIDTRMLAGSLVKLVTAVGVLQLVAEGTVQLDGAANEYLRSLRVASDAVTLRQLLIHSAGVSSDFDHFTEQTQPAVDVLGPLVSLDFAPGSRREYSNGGYTVLGEVIAGVSGIPAVDFLASRVLEPLGMSASSFALAWPDDVGPGYAAVDGRAQEMPRLVPSVPAAGGLVTTTGDLARFVAGWRSLLPPELAEAAVTPQVERDGGGMQGFGWLVGTGMLGHAGGTQTHTSSLLWRTSDGLVTVVMTNRATQAEAINLELQALVTA